MLGIHFQSFAFILEKNKENIRVHEEEEEAPVQGEVINATASGSKF